MARWNSLVNELRVVRPDARVTLCAMVAESGRLPSGWEESYTEPLEGRCDRQLVVELAERCANLMPEEQMDSWLAPRLHCALRIARADASNEGMWSWLALHCHSFVQARFGADGARVHPWRYNGVWSRNALSRLWWGAEMTRNGPDYGATPLCFSRVRTAQFALELMYSWDRAAAIAFVRVAEGADGGPRLPDSSMKELSKRLKVYLTLRGLDGFGDGSEEETDESDPAWIQHIPSLRSLLVADVKSLRGPNTGKCLPERIGRLVTWFREIVDGTGDPQEQPSPA